MKTGTTQEEEHFEDNFSTLNGSIPMKTVKPNRKSASSSHFSTLNGSIPMKTDIVTIMEVEALKFQYPQRVNSYENIPRGLATLGLKTYDDPKFLHPTPFL